MLTFSSAFENFENNLQEMNMKMIKNFYVKEKKRIKIIEQM